VKGEEKDQTTGKVSQFYHLDCDIPYDVINETNLHVEC